MSSSETMNALTAGMGRVSLEEVLDTANLQARLDRKYLVPLGRLTAVLAEAAGRLRVLEIDETRVFRYESVYFDTPDLLTYHQHAYGRRRRTKIRTRAYLDSGECLLEFKRVGSRGETLKERFPYPLSSRFELDTHARELALERLGGAVDRPALEASLTTKYLRTTLVDTVRGCRMTCDVDLRFEGPGRGTYGPTESLVVVESKSIGGNSLADRALRAAGARPVSLSKYCVGLAVLDRRLPANRWNRELRTHFAWTPER